MMEQPSSTDASDQPPRSPLQTQGRTRGDPRSPRRGGDRRRGGRGSRHAGRGRGAAERRRSSLSSQPIDPTKPILEAKEIETQQEMNTVNENRGNASGEAEEEVCFICASPVVHNAIAPCNHKTCHICALRLRALYKTKACAHCRANAEFVLFTDDANKRYEDFTGSDFARSDWNLGIKYEREEIFEDTVLLLRYNCPNPSCDMACFGWPDLHKHVRNVHKRMMCDLCTRNKKVFTHEHELFTHAELRKHEKYGDDNPGAVDQSGFKGHPECGFCRERFYGDDELYTHCRDKHERCHICDRRQTGQHQQYYLNYDELEKHFSKDHFLCPDRECLDKKFVVFESEMDLKAHQLESHPNGLSKDARRDARRVDMSGFDYRQTHQDDRHNNRREGRGRGRGRGRDPNADEPLPLSTAQPMRRDELAYQRQLAIHSSQSVTNRTFGGQLTSGNAYTTRPSNQEPSTVTAPRANQGGQSLTPQDQPLASLDTLTIDPAQNLSPAERARQLRHTAVIERASNLLKNDQASINTFRSNVSSYRNSQIAASALVDSFFTLFDSNTTELGTLIKELADIFEISTKREDLLKAWNDWRAINEDYPSLPGPNGVPAGGTSSTTGSGGKRILKLKSSTAQSNPANRPTGTPRNWGATSITGGKGPRPNVNGMAFPPMPSSSNRGVPGGVPWVKHPSSSSTAVAPSSSSTSRPANSRATNTATAPSNAANAFPALPTAQKPSMNVSRPGYTGNPRLKGERSGTATPVNAWSGGNMNANGNLAAAVDAAVAEEEAGGGESKGKGKGRKKVVMHWG